MANNFRPRRIRDELLQEFENPVVDESERETESENSYEVLPYARFDAPFLCSEKEKIEQNCVDCFLPSCTLKKSRMGNPTL